MHLNSRCSGVDVVKTAKHRSADNPAAASRLLGSWCLEIEAPMRAVNVVVLEELGEDGVEMVLVDHDHVVQAFGTD